MPALGPISISWPSTPTAGRFQPDDPASPDAVNFRRVELLRDIMVRNGDAAKHVMITEGGLERPSTLDEGRSSGPARRRTPSRAYEMALRDWPWVDACAMWAFRYPRPAAHLSGLLHLRRRRFPAKADLSRQCSLCPGLASGRKRNRDSVVQLGRSARWLAARRAARRSAPDDWQRSGRRRRAWRDASEQTGVWRVGMDPASRPSRTWMGSQASWSGFDVDLARAVRGALGRATPRSSAWASIELIDAVVANRVDSAISALPVASHRTEESALLRAIRRGWHGAGGAGTSRLRPTSRGWSRNGEAAMTEVANASRRRVAAEWGSEGDALARRLLAQVNGDLRLVLRNSTDDALRAVLDRRGGRSDRGRDQPRALRRDGGSLVAVGQPLRSDPYAIVVPTTRRSCCAR